MERHRWWRKRDTNKMSQFVAVNFEHSNHFAIVNSWDIKCRRRGSGNVFFIGDQFTLFAGGGQRKGNQMTEVRGPDSSACKL